MDSELCNLSRLTSAEGEYSAAEPDNAAEPLNSFVWLACIQACEPCPTQSAAIVTLRILQRLCDGLQCYMAVSSLSLSLLLSLYNISFSHAETL